MAGRRGSSTRMSGSGGFGGGDRGAAGGGGGVRVVPDRARRRARAGDRAGQGPPFDPVPMFHNLVLQTPARCPTTRPIPAARRAVVHALRRAGAARRRPRRQDDVAVPRGTRPRRAFERLSARFDTGLAERGTWPRTTRSSTRPSSKPPPAADAGQKDVVNGSSMPEDWTPARTRQIDRDGRWTLNAAEEAACTQRRGPHGSARDSGADVRLQEHVRVDHEHGSVRRFAVTHAAAHDGAQAARCSTPATPRGRSGRTPPSVRQPDIGVLERRSLKPEFQRPKPRDSPCRATSPVATPAAPASVGAWSGVRRPEAPFRPRGPHRQQGPRHSETRAGNLAYDSPAWHRCKIGLSPESAEIARARCAGRPKRT